MPCKHYKDALIETAASGTEPQGDLHAHLAGCADCRAAFALEQSLFASMDAGLHVTANAEVPASLLPGVRVRLDEQSEPPRLWVNNWLVLASAAVMVVAFFAARSLWRMEVIKQPGVTAVKSTVPPQVTVPAQNRGTAVEPPRGSGVPMNPLVIAKNHPAHDAPGEGKTAPEVLVPHDQEILLAQYAEQWNAHKHPMLLAQRYDATILPPLQVAPIQIDELGVKLLGDEKSQ